MVSSCFKCWAERRGFSVYDAYNDIASFNGRRIRASQLVDPSTNVAGAQDTAGTQDTTTPALQTNEGGNGAPPPTEVQQDTRPPLGTVMRMTTLGWVWTNHHRYVIGDIIIAPHVSPNINNSVREGDTFAARITEVGPVTGKMRPHIVIGIHESSLTCLPIFSSNGRGFSAQNSTNSLWIRRWDDDSNFWDSVAESKFLTAMPNYQGAPFSYIDLTRAVPVLFAYPINNVGTLTSTSINRVKSLYKDWIDKSMMDFNGQAAFAATSMNRHYTPGEWAQINQDYVDGFQTVDHTRRRGGRGNVNRGQTDYQGDNDLVPPPDDQIDRPPPPRRFPEQDPRRRRQIITSNWRGRGNGRGMGDVDLSRRGGLNQGSSSVSRVDSQGRIQRPQ